MDQAGIDWWTARQLPCPQCGGVGIPIILDMQDAESAEAVRSGLADLGGCGLGGARFDHVCRDCGHRWDASQ